MVQIIGGMHVRIPPTMSHIVTVTVTAMQNKMKDQIQATEDLFTLSMNRIEQNMKDFQKHQIELAKAHQQANVTMIDFQQN